MKKLALSLFLMVLVAAFIFTGCTNTSPAASVQPSTGTTQTPTAAPIQSAGPVTLNILSTGDTWNPDNAFLPLIEKATNTKLVMTIVPGDQYSNKRNVVMASGSYPNVIRISYMDPMYASYTKDGLFLALDAILDKYPKIRDAYGTQIWDANRASDGHIYHIPRIDIEQFPNLLMFRSDVLSKNNLAIPTTTEELRTVLEALKKANPDPSYAPYVGNRNDLSDLDPFFSAFGTYRNIWQASDKDPTKIVYSTTTEKFKNALKYISSLRKDGLFEQEWYVGKNRGIDKFYIAKAEFTMDCPQYIEYRIPDVQAVVPDAVIDYIPEFKSADGKLYGAQMTKNSQGDGFAMVKGSTPEQIEAMISLVNWFYDGDGYKMLKYGVEGKTYTVVDGKIVPNDREKNPPEYDMENMDRFDFAYSPTFTSFIRDLVPAAVSDAQFEVAKKAIAAAYKNPIINYASYLDDAVITANLNVLNNLSEELITKAILSPNADVDALFKEYNDKLVQNKLNEVTEAINRLNSSK